MPQVISGLFFCIPFFYIVLSKLIYAACLPDKLYPLDRRLPLAARLIKPERSDDDDATVYK